MMGVIKTKKPLINYFKEFLRRIELYYAPMENQLVRFKLHLYDNNLTINSCFFKKLLYTICL